MDSVLHGLRVVAALKPELPDADYRDSRFGVLHGLRVVAALKPPVGRRVNAQRAFSTAFGSWPH